MLVPYLGFAALAVTGVLSLPVAVDRAVNDGRFNFGGSYFVPGTYSLSATPETTLISGNTRTPNSAAKKPVSNSSAKKPVNKPVEVLTSQEARRRRNLRQGFRNTCLAHEGSNVSQECSPPGQMHLFYYGAQADQYVSVRQSVTTGLSTSQISDLCDTEADSKLAETLD
ncbi:MAG: hypothetical protein M1823_001183 [Watsoniomyces obsoletus]|nr:MAG: hypothetical protein M1823_001183 [Watsoniomyces obsoletus]